MAIVIAAPAFAVLALDIDTIYVSSIKDHTDGVAWTNPWVFEVWIDIDEMANLEHIDVTKPGDSGPSIVMNSANDWEHMSPTDYSSLANLQVDYPTGNYTFDFRDSGSGLIRSIVLDYSGVANPAGPVDIFPPLEGEASFKEAMRELIRSGSYPCLHIWGLHWTMSTTPVERVGTHWSVRAKPPLAMTPVFSIRPA